MLKYDKVKLLVFNGDCGYLLKAAIRSTKSLGHRLATKKKQKSINKVLKLAKESRFFLN